MSDYWALLNMAKAISPCRIIGLSDYSIWLKSVDLGVENREIQRNEQ